MTHFRLVHLYALVLILYGGCKRDDSVGQSTESSGSIYSRIILEELPASQTGIDFVNRIEEEGRINIFTWHFLYNGAGVAAGDINNDGLPDLYFTGNMVPDRLYLNKGNFEFEDITANAGISSQIWSSGVTMADVNADGLIDIYVCKNSPTGNENNNRNKLYINQGNNVFREQAALYGIDDIGFSTQASFFDADNDGDLDMYLVNQPFDEFSRLVNRPDVVARYPQTDRFFFFENGKFVDKTALLGLQNARYGLNVSIGDYDLNGWTDVFVANDYHHADHLYMNHQGKFTDELTTRTGHLAFYSMGSDVGDVNMDGWLDLFSLDMAFEDHVKSKTNMGSMDPARFFGLVADGHHYQYMQNALQINMGLGFFQENAQLAGLSKSDWSYATLFSDLDLDGDQDILITNGMLRDLQNNDFNDMVKSRYKGMVGPDNYLEILHSLPSNPVANIIFTNEGNLKFTKLAPENGFNTPGFSHGMVYADLDGDGLQDIVINNVNAPASIYKNISTTEGHYLKLRLKGPGRNLQGLGCSVILYAGGQSQIQAMQTTRGYFSAVEALLHFGLGSASKVDSILVIWNHESVTLVKNISTNTTVTIDYAKEKKLPFRTPTHAMVPMTEVDLCSFTHQERLYDDYAQQVLLPYKLSQNGPHISVGDLNGDMREDFFIGGASGQAGVIFLQNNAGRFEQSVQPALEKDKLYEDQESVLIDVDADGDLDLVIASGTNEFNDKSPYLNIRMYINDGKGNFSTADKKVFPEWLINGQCIEAFDMDGDKDLDLLVGGRLVGGQYGVSADSRLLINQSGSFKDQTLVFAPDLLKLGMVTDIVSDDVDQDGDIDFLVVGEWMVPTLFLNDGNGNFTSLPIDDAGSGLWWTIEKGDFDKDGDTDFILGNLGWNNKFGGSGDTKLEIYAGDLDDNGDFDVVLANAKTDKVLPVRGRECSSEEIPYILEKFPTYISYANAELAEIYDADKLQAASHKKLSTMASIYLRNDGGGNFTVSNLPTLCQTGPVKAFLVDDVNGDGHPDFIYAGNHLPTEVETARYDGLYPGVCFGDGKGDFTCRTLLADGRLRVEDVRDIKMITLGDGRQVYLFANNNGLMRAYVLNAKDGMQ